MSGRVLMTVAAGCIPFVCLTSCTVGPDYERPDLGVVTPERYTEADAAPAEPDLAVWWERFGDDELTSLVREALGGNPELAEVRERIVEARARRGIENAERLPTLDGRAGYTRAQTGEEGFILGGAPAGAEVDVFSLGAIAGWEIDLWGRVARLVEAAEAEIGFAVEDYRAARVALAAEVARELIAIRSLDEELAIVEATTATDRDTLAISRSRAQAGFGDELDVSRAERVVRRNSATLPELRGLRREAEVRLSVLLGMPLEGVAVEGSGLPRRDIVPAVGVPADLILRRPDVRRAERALAAEHARIGAAMAERYPRVTLSGSFDFQGTDFGDTFNPDAFVLGVGPSISMPLLDGGRITARVDAAESRTRQALLRLHQRILEAVGEVEAAAAVRRRSEERASILAEAEAAARDTEAFALARYRAGVVDFLDVTEASTQLLAIRRERVTAERDALLRLVDLYAALGGGWDATGHLASTHSPPLTGETN